MKTSYYLVTAAGLTVAAVVVYTQQSGRSGARELPPAATAQAKPSEPAEPAPFALAEMSLPPVVTPPDAPLVIPAANQAPVRPLPPMTVEPAIAAPTTPAAPLPQPQAAPTAPVVQPSTPAPLPIPPVISSPATPASPPPGTPAIPVISPIAPPTTLANPVPGPATPIAPVVVPPAPAENAAPETPIKPIAPAAPAVPPAIPPSAPVSPPLPAAPQAGSSGENPAAPIAPASPLVVPQQPVIQPNPTPQPAPMKPKSDAVSTPPVAPKPAAVLPQPAPLPTPSAQPKPLPLLPAPRRETAAPAAPGESKFIVVKGNKLIEGSISVVGEKAMIRQGSLERSMPKTDVLFVGESKDEVYRFMLAKLPPNDAAGRLGVARWCMFAGMREQALAEAREVLKLAPGNPSATQLVRTLEESLKLYPSDGSTPLATARPTGGTLEAEPDVDLTAEGATTFASHAQPVLANKCMECHARPDYPGSFKLIRVTGFEVGPQSTKANMRSTAAQLKKEDPLNSPL
ncbi:MAG TPA: hypothetical protein VLM40_16590, partial [Gemmata sp.]|nr:hypothetical protein [Gemmata sp.]